MANRIQLEAILKFVGVDADPRLFNAISRAAAGMPGPIQQTAANMRQVNTQAVQVQRSVRGVTNQLSASEKAASSFLRRMAQFAVLLPTFATMNRAIQGSVKFLFDFDTAIRDIIRVDISGLSERFDEIANSAFELGKNFGISAVEAANSIKTFVQAGFAFEQANKMAELSLLAVRSSTLEAADAVEFLLSANKQFGLEGANLEKALDALVKSEDLAAVEAQDIAEAFRTGGNSLAFFSKNINDSIGLISALREQTRKSGREIGTFFKTLQTRIFAEGESRSALEALGVQVQNLDGSLRPTIEVLNDTKIAFDGLTEAEQANAAKAIAGVRQFESLIATLQSLDRANSLSSASSNSAGIARKKEAADSEKLQRRLDELIVAAQELAFTLGKAGGTRFFKDLLKFATTSTEAITKLVDMLDKLGVSILPILAPLGIKGLATVFGFGKPGGGGGRGGMPGGAVGVPPGMGPFDKAMASNTAALHQLTSTIAVTAQQMRILMTATMTQSQLTQVNAALEGVQNKAIAANTAAFQANTRTVGAQAQAAGLMSKEAFKSAAKYALLTVGASALAATLNKAAGSMDSLAVGAGDGVRMLSTMTQTGIQFGAMFGPQVGIVAGALTGLISVISDTIDAYDGEIAALEDMQTMINQSDKEQRTNFALNQSNMATQFVEGFAKEINGKLGKQIDFDKAFSAGIKKSGLEASAEEVRDILFSNMSIAFEKIGNQIVPKVTKGAGEQLIKTFVNLDSSLFKNQDALNELKSSYDENGKSTLKYHDQLNLLLLAMGKAEDEMNAVAGVVQSVLIKSFKEMKEVMELASLAQEVNRLGRAIQEAKVDPLVEGIDLLRKKSANAAQDMAAVQGQFDILLRSLNTLGAAEFQIPADDAKKLLEKLSEFINAVPTTLNDDLINNFVQDLPENQRKFADEYLKLEKERRESVLKSAESEQTIRIEISKRNKKLVEDEKNQTLKAMEALGKFNAELGKFGDIKVTPELESQLAGLKPEDMRGIFGGTSDLPEQVQAIIKNGFMDPLQKAQAELSRIGQSTSAELDPLNSQLADLDKEIQALSNALPNTEAGFKKNDLMIERSAKVLEIEEVKRQGLINTIEASISLAEATKKADEEAAEAEEKRLKKTQELTNATFEFNNIIKDVGKSFNEFAQDRFAELLQKEADAQTKLKEAHGEVINATADLDTAYKSYISTLFQVNGLIAEAQIRINLLGRDIGSLNGSIVTFDDGLTSLQDAFNSVLQDANMNIEQRIDLERQLAQETLDFLQRARDEIVNAGIGIFGQSAEQNNQLAQGIAGLQFVAEQLGGSFQNFMGMDANQIDALSQNLLNLPQELRQQILDALSFLPSSVSIGGFSIEQLRQAIGQIGAGVGPDEGLPSIEELNTQQVEQLKILQNLAMQDAQLQFSQVAAAQEALEKAQEQLDITKILEERASTELESVRIAVQGEKAAIDAANIQRQELLQKVIDASNVNSLHAIEEEARQFAEQNSVFRDVGQQIVQGISQAIGGRLAVIEAQNALASFAGYVPNLAGGNLTPGEAAGVLRAAQREKQEMPGGSRLAVANTSEAIIPMRNKGFIPNFASGNGGSIAAGIESIRGINEAVVAAISRSVSLSLADLNTGGKGTTEILESIKSQLSTLNDTISQINTSNAAIENNTSFTTATAATPTARTSEDVKITIQTSQNNTISLTGLENLPDQIRQVVRDTATAQADQQIEPLINQIEAILKVLGERNLLSSLGQTR